jgi:hypothetical protein
MSTQTRRPTFAQFLASHVLPEPIIPAGRVRCERCDGHGVEITGFAHEMPVEERCPACAGFGHREQRAIGFDKDEHEAFMDETYAAAESIRRHEAQRSIDIDKAEHEATLPNYVALSHETIAAGLEPF